MFISEVNFRFWPFIPLYFEWNDCNCFNNSIAS
jgi:hypothetical protein